MGGRTQRSQAGRQTPIPGITGTLHRLEGLRRGQLLRALPDLEPAFRTPRSSPIASGMTRSARILVSLTLTHFWSLAVNAGRGSRTPTPLPRQRILSPPCLPVPSSRLAGSYRAHRPVSIGPALPARGPRRDTRQCRGAARRTLLRALNPSLTLAPGRRHTACFATGPEELPFTDKSTPAVRRGRKATGPGVPGQRGCRSEGPCTTPRHPGRAPAARSTSAGPMRRSPSPAASPPGSSSGPGEAVRVSGS